MKTLAINLQNTETWPHLCLQLVKQIRSSTWENNARRGKRDPWTYSSHRMRCLIKPTSIWAHRADKRGERRSLRSMESRPTSCRRAGSRSQYSSAQRGGRGTSWKQPASCPRGQAVIDSAHCPPRGCDTLARKDGPASAFSPAWAHLAFIDPYQGIGCCGGCFMMMIILSKLTYWHVTYTQKEKS